MCRSLSHLVFHSRCQSLFFPCTPHKKQRVFRTNSASVAIFAAHHTATGGDTRTTLDRWLSLMRKGWETCVILTRLRSCCKDMGTLVAPALARSGVCGYFAHLRHNEWLVAYGKVKPTRYPSIQIEFFTNKRSWPHGLVRLRAPHDLWFFHPRAGELSPCTVSELDEISSEESSESET